MNENLHENKSRCPCRGCERRTVGCHSTCDDYKQFKDEKDRQNEAHHREVELRGFILTTKNFLK